MKQTLRLVFLIVLMACGHATSAVASGPCEVYIGGASTSQGHLRDYFNNEVWSGSDYLYLGYTSDATDCYLDAYNAVLDYGYFTCLDHESGRSLDILGDVYFNGGYYNGWYAPFQCTDYVGGSGGLNNYTTLASGDSLQPGHSITNGSYTLIYQTDGNIVVYNGSTPVWAGNCWPVCTNWGSAGAATMKTDGNFVVTNSAQTEVWMSASVETGAFLALRNNGELVVYSTSGQWLWSSVRGHP